MKKMIKKILALTLSVVTVVVTFSSCNFEIDFNYCQHTLEEIEKVDASCMKVGKKTAYKCTKCGQLFAYGYLNGKDGEKGIYEIDGQEVLPFAGHKIGCLYGDLKSDMTSYDATSLEDFSVWSICSEDGCNEPFEVELQNLIAFAPADDCSGNAKHVVEGEEMDATKFEIAAGTSSGSCIQIYTGDSGMENATHEIPFSANTDRNVVLFLHNDGAQDIDVRYGIECYGERSGADVTVPANGYATLSFAINVSKSQDNSWHELYINSDIESKFNLTIAGYYYHATKLQGVKIDAYPQIEYAIGETFNAEGLVVLANYGSGITRKLSSDEYTLVLNNNKAITEPLTSEDDTVYVIHNNKQTDFTIKVQKFEQTVTLKNATFADGTSSKVMDRNALIPSDIKATGDKTVAYFVDQYGVEYVLGESKVPAYNVTLTPIYAGVTYSENYALGMDVTASSTNHGGRTAQLVNGIHSMNSDEDGRWSSNSNYDTATPDAADREWVMVDLGEVKSVSKVVLYPRVYGSYFPEGYEILVSEDGETWTTVVVVEKDELASKNGTQGRFHYFESVNAQYVKVVATKMTNDNGSYGYIFQLSEIEIYGEVANNA